MPQVYFITGNDQPTIHAAGKKLAEQLAGPDADAFGLETYAESDERPADRVIQDLIGAILTPPFLGGQKVVWLQHFSDFSMEAPKSKKPESPLQEGLRRLAELIAAGLPADIVLVMDGLGAKEKGPLYLACAAAGKAESHKKPDLKDRDWQAQVARLLDAAARERGMRISRAGMDYLTDVIGVDTARIGTEMEKILCYAGTEPQVEQIMDVCTGSREAVFYALNSAIDARDLNGAMKIIAQFMDRAKNPDSEAIRLVRMTAKNLQDMLHARVLMGYLRVGPHQLAARVASLSAAERERYAGNPLLDAGDWKLGKTAQAAARYEGPELIAAVKYLAATDRSLVSSPLPRRLLLEITMARVIAGTTANRAG